MTGIQGKKGGSSLTHFLSDLTPPRPLLSQDARARECCREHSRESTAAGPRPQTLAIAATAPGSRPRDVDARQKRCVLAHAFFIRSNPPPTSALTGRRNTEVLPRAQPREYGRGTKAADTSDHGRGHVSAITAPGCGHEAERCVLLRSVFCWKIWTAGGRSRGGCGRGGRVQGEDEGSRQPGGRRT